MQPRFKTTHTTPDKLLENVFPPVAVSQLTVQTDSDEEIAFLQTQVDGEVHLLFSERISDHAWVNSDDLAGAAYSNHQWVTLQALLVALDTQNNIIVDNNREFSIYPPLWNLLLQKNTLMTLMSERRRKTCKPMLEDDGVAIDVMNDEAPDDLKPTIYHQWMLNHYLLKKDMTAFIKLLQDFPALKFSSITEVFLSVTHDNPFILAAKSSEMPLDDLIIYYGNEWIPALKSLEFTTFDSLIKLLKRIPITHRPAFIKEGNNHHNNRLINKEYLQGVVLLIAEDDRASVIIYLLESPSDSPLLSHYEMCNMVNILRSVPGNHQLRVAEKLASLMPSGYYLKSLMEYLEPTLRHDFLSRHKDKLQTGSGISEVICLFPENERFDLAMEFSSFVKNACLLSDICKFLPKQHIAAFIMHCVPNLTGESENGNVSLHRLSQCIPGEEMPRFVMLITPYLTSYFYSFLIIARLNHQDRKDYLLQNKEKAARVSHLNHLLLDCEDVQQSELNHTIYMMHYLYDQSVYRFDFLGILKMYVLPHKRLEVLLTFHHLYTELSHLGPAVSLLPEEDALTFVDLMIDKVTTTESCDISKLIGALPIKRRVHYVEKLKDALGPQFLRCLVNVLLEIDKNERFSFLLKQVHLSNEAAFTDCIAKLTPDERFRFVTHPEYIKVKAMNSMALFYILRILTQEGDALLFAMMFRQFISNDGDLSMCASQLPECDQPGFILYQQDLIPAIHLDWFRERVGETVWATEIVPNFYGQMENNTEFVKLLASTSKENQLYLANNYLKLPQEQRQKVGHFQCAEQMHKNLRLQFIEMHLNALLQTNSLLQLAKLLNETSSFILSHQAAIRSNEKLILYTPLVKLEQRAEFIKNHFDKINAYETFLTLMHDAPVNQHLDLKTAWGFWQHRQSVAKRQSIKSHDMVCRLKVLPWDLIIYIARYLDGDDLISLSKVIEDCTGRKLLASNRVQNFNITLFSSTGAASRVRLMNVGHVMTSHQGLLSTQQALLNEYYAVLYKMHLQHFVLQQRENGITGYPLLCSVNALFHAQHPDTAVREVLFISTACELPAPRKRLMQMLQDNEAHLAGLERKLELMGRELMLDNVQAKTPEQHKWLFWRNKQLGGSTEPDAINEMPSLRQAINMVSSPFIDRDALGIGTNIWRRRFACSLIPMLNSCEFLDEAYISHLLSQLPDAADKCEVAQLVAPHITRVASLHSVIEALPYLERADYAIQVLEQLKSSKNVLPSFEEFMQLLTSIKLSYAAFNETVSIRQQLLAHECRYMNYCLPNLALMAGFDATKIVAILKCLHSVKATSLTAWKLIDRIDTEDLLNAVLEHVHLDEQEDYRREVNERWECEKSCHLKLG